MTFLKKLVGARWFPTITKPVLAGAIGAGVTVVLHTVAHVNILPGTAESAAAPLVGLLLTAITNKPTASVDAGTAHVTVVGHVLEGQPSIGKQVASQYFAQLVDVIDSDPNLIQNIAESAMKRLAPAVAAVEKDVPAPVVQEIKQAVETIISTPPATPAPAVQQLVTPASTQAPHITQP